MTAMTPGQRVLLCGAAALALAAVQQARRQAQAREARESLAALAAQLAASEAQRHAIAGRLARLDHDLRTPIGTLMAAVNVLERAPEGPMRSEALQVLSRQLGRFGSFAEALHRLSRELDAPPGQPGA